MPHEPDIVPQHPPRIYGHVLSERKNTGCRFDVMLLSEREKNCYIFVHASPPESPEQEISIPHEPDIVPQHPPRIYGHVFSERKNHLLHIRSCFPSGISGTGKIHTARSRYSPAAPVTNSRSCPFRKEKTPVADSISCFPPKGKTCYTFVHAFFFGISGTGKIHTAQSRYCPATPSTNSRSYSLRKEKHLLHICSCCFLRRKRLRRNRGV